MQPYSIIKLDDLNWKVRKHSINKKTGKPTESLVGYYPTIGSAVNAMFELAVKDEVADVFPINREEIQSIMDKAKDKVIGAINEAQL